MTTISSEIIHFPSPENIFLHFNLFLFSGPLMLCFSLYTLFRIFRDPPSLWAKKEEERRNLRLQKLKDLAASMPAWLKNIVSPSRLIPDAAQPTSPHMRWVFVVIPAMIGLVHMMIYLSVANAIHFQKIRLDQVSALEFEELGEGYKVQLGPLFSVTDPEEIKRALSQLANDQTSFSSQHEHMLSGIRIRLRGVESADGESIYLSVYSKSNRRSNLSVVIPHFGESAESVQKTGGSYSSPLFLAWVEEKMKNH